MGIANTVYIFGNKTTDHTVWIIRMDKSNLAQLKEVLLDNKMDKPDRIITAYEGGVLEHEQIAGAYMRHGEHGEQTWPTTANNKSERKQKYGGGWFKHRYHLQGALSTVG